MSARYHGPSLLLRSSVTGYRAYYSSDGLLTQGYLVIDFR
jgi:hypothetical protein